MKKILGAILIAQTALAGAAFAHDAVPRTGGEPNWVGGKCVVDANARTMAQLEVSFERMPKSTRKKVQHLMRHANMYSGELDGIWGKRTECGIRQIASRYPGAMNAEKVTEFWDYMMIGPFIFDYPGTPSAWPHEGTLY